MNLDNNNNNKDWPLFYIDSIEQRFFELPHSTYEKVQWWKRQMASEHLGNVGLWSSGYKVFVVLLGH